MCPQLWQQSAAAIRVQILQSPDSDESRSCRIRVPHCVGWAKSRFCRAWVPKRFVRVQVLQNPVSTESQSYTEQVHPIAGDQQQQRFKNLDLGLDYSPTRMWTATTAEQLWCSGHVPHVHRTTGRCLCTPPIVVSDRCGRRGHRSMCDHTSSCVPHIHSRTVATLVA